MEVSSDTLRIRDRFKITVKRNPVSGHEWIEHGPTTGYEIVYRGFVVANAKTQEKADSLYEEWKAFHIAKENS